MELILTTAYKLVLLSKPVHAYFPQNPFSLHPSAALFILSTPLSSNWFLLALDITMIKIGSHLLEAADITLYHQLIIPFVGPSHLTISPANNPSQGPLSPHYITS